MTNRLSEIAIVALILPISIAFPPAATAQEKKSGEAKITFEENVRAIFTSRCTRCHNAERPRGELDLTSYAAAMQGGISGNALVSGKPDASLLFLSVMHREDPKMPPNGKIPQVELDTIQKWIQGGLVEKAGDAVKKEPGVRSSTVKLDGLGAATAFARPTPLTALAVSPTQPLAAVSGVKQVLIYDLAARKSLGGLAFPEGEVHVLRFSRDGKWLLAAGGVGGQSGAVVGYEVGSWKRVFSIRDENEAILAADLSTDNSLVVFGGPGRVVKVTSVPSGKLVHTFKKPTDWVLSTAFSPEGLLVAAGDRFGGVYVWETKSGKEFYTLRGHTKGVTGIVWGADSNTLATSSEDHTVRRWDMHTGTEIEQWEASQQGLLDIAMLPDGVLATAGRDGYVRTWAEKGKMKAELGPVEDAVLKISATGDAKTILSADWAGGVRTWPASGGAGERLPVALSAKGPVAAAIPVPTPSLPPSIVRTEASVVGSHDLERKRAALKAVEEAAEKLKDESARNPKNAALAKAYLQLCEAALAMKTEVVEAEAVVNASRAAGGKQ